MLSDVKLMNTCDFGTFYVEFYQDHVNRSIAMKNSQMYCLMTYNSIFIVFEQVTSGSKPERHRQRNAYPRATFYMIWHTFRMLMETKLTKNI